jgi:hypothetical protein
MSLKFTSVMMFVLLAVSAFAQSRTKAEIKAEMAASATTSCFATFTTALPNFCVTQNGNIENFVFPAGFSQIFTDGYGICDFTTSETSYYDDGDQDSGNWLNPVISEPNGHNTFPLTITRTSADGIWTIKQIFSRNTADAYVKVAITWTNNTAVGRVAYFTRYVDIDADGNINDPTLNFFDGSANSGWGYSPASAGNSHGLTVRSNQSNNNLLGFVTSFSAAQGGNHDPCFFTPNTTPRQGDQAVMYVWAPGNLSFTVPARGKVTQTLEFRPM